MLWGGVQVMRLDGGAATTLDEIMAGRPAVLGACAFGGGCPSRSRNEKYGSCFC